MLDFIDTQIFLMVTLYFKIISKDIHKGAHLKKLCLKKMVGILTYRFEFLKNVVFENYMEGTCD